uniref:Uncharacterized protein n=1 Tax=Glossina palpalis gambiensis TaxID=67801 RepID=A0A1B0ATC4_9MUSC
MLQNIVFVFFRMRLAQNDQQITTGLGGPTIVPTKLAGPPPSPSDPAISKGGRPSASDCGIEATPSVPVSSSTPSESAEVPSAALGSTCAAPRPFKNCLSSVISGMLAGSALVKICAFNYIRDIIQTKSVFVTNTLKFVHVLNEKRLSCKESRPEYNLEYLFILYGSQRYDTIFGKLRGRLKCTCSGSSSRISTSSSSSSSSGSSSSSSSSSSSDYSMR